jgi:DNA-binding transcriptional regulator YdaS (Cro superfamily)
MTKQEAIAHFKGARHLADALGIETASVYQWGDRVPPLRQLQLQQITKGALKAEPGLIKPKSAA